MKRWEYLYLELPHGRTERSKVAGEAVDRIPQIEEILDAYGADGWEVVSSTHWGTAAGVGKQPRFLLKRPIEE